MPSPASSNSIPSDSVPKLQKFGYGLGSVHDMWGHWLYPALAFQVFNIYLGVSPSWIARALLCKLVFEAVWDSVFGWWSDNTRTRFGRRRPFILAGSVLAGVMLPVMFLVQRDWAEINYFWYMFFSMAVLVPCMSCFYMPYQSLGYESTPSYEERTAVFAWRNAMQKIPEVAMFAAAAFTTAGVWVGATWTTVPERLGQLIAQTFHWFVDMGAALFTLNFGKLGVLVQTLFGWTQGASGSKPDILIGAQVYTLILGAIMILAGIGVFVFTRERYYDKLVVERKQGKISIKATLGQALSCRPFRVNLSMALAYGIGTSMVSTLGYYATVYYVCRGDVASGATWNFWMGLTGMVLGLAGIPVYSGIARKVGKKFSMILVQCCAIAGFIATWWLYTPHIQWLQVISCGVTAFTGAGFWVLYGSMTADVIDYDEIETGNRREGAFAACASWIMKLGVALGSWASGEILDQVGFKQSLGGDQSPHTIFMIRILLASIPVIGLVVALGFLIRFPLTPKKMAELRQQLEARRGKV